MCRSSNRFAGIATALLLGAHGAAAQTLLYPPAKIAEVYERNHAEERIAEDRIWDSGEPIFWALLDLGDHTTALGEPAHAQAWADDGGTFWATVNADNNNPPYRDNGNGEASTTLAYAMHKEEGEPAEVTLHVTGGTLELVDYGGGTEWLETAVLLQVDIKLVGTDIEIHQERFAALTGRGGMKEGEAVPPDVPESFQWSADGFEIGSYTETAIGKGIVGAKLEIPKQELRYDLSGFCGTCDIEFWIELSVIASNPGSETKAYAYFRDPVHIHDPEPDLGGTSVSWAGVTLLPPPQLAPEPRAAAAVAALAAVLALRAWT